AAVPPDARLHVAIMPAYHIELTATPFISLVVDRAGAEAYWHEGPRATPVLSGVESAWHEEGDACEISIALAALRQDTSFRKGGVLRVTARLHDGNGRLQTWGWPVVEKVFHGLIVEIGGGIVQ